jgi:hypothetical protein
MRIFWFCPLTRLIALCNCIVNMTVAESMPRSKRSWRRGRHPRLDTALPGQRFTAFPQLRLVGLDGENVMRSGIDDQLRGLTASVGGIGGDHASGDGQGLQYG